MLMYRQIDKDRNREAYTIQQFPAHITKLMSDMKEESERQKKELDNDTMRIKIYCHLQNSLSEEKMLVFGDTLLSEATSDAYSKFKLEDVVKLEDCRLVVYNKSLEAVIYSIENDCKFSDITSRYTEFLLEIKKPG